MKRILIWQSLVTSVLMGFYMHLVFWGGVGAITIRPPIETFRSAILYVALPAGIYLFSQALPVAIRPQMAVWLLFADWAASIFPIAETYLIFIRYSFGYYEPTGFQAGALMFWVLSAAVDLRFIVIASLLLRRSVGLVPSYG